jgi:hypothetical protein
VFSHALEFRWASRFDTSATRGLRSPSASGSGKAHEKEKEKEKEREVTSTEQRRARSALAEITNAGAPSAVLKDASVAPAVVQKPVTRSQSAAPRAGTGAKAPRQRAPQQPSKPPHAGRQLTVPKSPRLLSRLRSDGRMRVKSTEELELEQIEKGRQALATKYKRKQAHEGPGGDDNVRSSKRLKAVGINALSVKGGGFTIGTEAADAGMRRSTRSSTRAKGSTGAWKPKLTVPQSPAFATNGRVRAPRYKSTEELQLEQIARARSAKGGHGKKGAAKAVSNPRSKSRIAPLTIPEPFTFATAACGAKSTTAARSAGAARTGTRSTKLVQSASAHPTQPTVFVEGPITRSRAYVVETKKRDKSRPASAVHGDAQAGGTHAAGTNECTSKGTKMNTRPRQAAKGASMLRGGAMRVVRTDADDPEGVDEARTTPGNPGSAVPGHGNASPPVSRDQPKSRGRSIFDSIAGPQARKRPSGEATRREGSPTRVTFEQLGRRNRFHNPLFEFKES